MMRTQHAIVTTVIAFTVSWPSNSTSDGRSTTLGNALVLEPQMSSAAFCRK